MLVAQFLYIVTRDSHIYIYCNALRIQNITFLTLYPRRGFAIACARAPGASEPSARRGGRGRDRLTTPDGSPGPPKLTLQSVHCEKICSQCEKASSRPCAPDRPSRWPSHSHPENHDKTMPDHALLAVVPSIHRVEWACQARDNGCDAFPDFLAAAYRMKRCSWRKSGGEIFRRDLRRGRCGIVRRARCGNSRRRGAHPRRVLTLRQAGLRVCAD